MRGLFPRTLIGLISALAAMLCLTAQARASYVTRFTTIDTGAMTFTGNTLGLDKVNNQNNPGGAGAIGAFITVTNPTSQVGTFPAGTTLDWTQDSSSAQLNIPAGSTVLYAELIWGGSYETANQNVSSSLGTSVTMSTPSGAYSVAPVVEKTTAGAGGQYYYVNSADVTAYVQAAGAGTYTVGGVPATVDPYENNSNCAGWTLAVVYRNTTMPIRSMSVFVGCEYSASGISSASAVSGFCVNNTGTINARLMVSAMEGDSFIAGDQMLFGPPGATQPVSGPNNLVGNFFGSQINNDSGTLDTSGTFGTLNDTPTTTTGTGAAIDGTRYGWDITNVDVSGILQHGETEASAQGTSNQDAYTISSIGIQVDVGAPSFPTTVMTVDKNVTFVGDTLTYTTRLDNTAGSADAQNVIYKSLPPTDTSFVPGSVMTSTDGVNYTSMPSANPITGFNIGNVTVGSQVWVQYQVTVNAVPLSPAPATYVTNSSWTYNFLSTCPGSPLLQATTSSNYTTATLIDRLDASKAASVSSAGGTSTITWTITVANTGLTNTAGSWLSDAVPAGTTYVAGSTTMNGAAVPDAGGNMPFASGGLINGPGRAAGVVDSGDTVTVVFKSTCPTASLPKTNVATIYPNGTGGTDPAVQAGASTSPINADLGVSVTDGVTSVVPGTPDTYTVTVTNNGPSTVSNFTLPVSLPIAVLSPAYTASTGTYNPATGSWTGLNLANGQQVTLTITGTIDPTATGTLAVTGTVAVPPGITDPNSANNTATDTDTLTPQADLAITVTDGQTTAQPGSQVTYTITVTNNGPSAVSSFWVKDTVPANLLNPAYTPSVGTYNVTTEYWSDVNLASGQSAVLTVQGTVQGGSPALVYSAQVSPPYNTTDPNSSNNTASDTDTVLNLSATETVSPSTTLTGGTVTYTVTLTSAASTATTVTQVTDTLPAGFTYKTGTTTGLTTANPTGTTGTVTWNGSWTLPANGSLTLTFQATASTTPGTYNSTATYSDAPYPVTSTGPTAPVQVIVQGISMTANPSAVIAGGMVSYTATLTNYLSLPVTVTSISDTLPSGFTYVTGTTTGLTTANPTGSSGTITWNGSWTLPANGTLTLTFSAASGSTDGTYNSNASFTVSGYPNTSSGPTAPVQVFHLNVAKTVNQPNTVAGGTVTYTVTMTNTGPNSVPVTQVADTLPSGFTYNTGTTTGMTTNNPTVSGQALTWNGSWTLPANGTLTLNFSATVSASEASGTYYNNVSFTPTGYPVQSSGNTAPVNVFQLTITKTAVQDEVANGGTVNYTITMTSTSSSPVTVTSVVEQLPDSNGGNFTYVYGSSSGMTTNNPTNNGHVTVGGTTYNQYTWSGSWTIPANGSLTLNFNATANGTNGQTYYNNASFTTAYGTLSTGNTADVTISNYYAINETVNTAYAMPGGTVIYTITMTNTSNNNRTVTSVSDTLPTGFTYVPGSSSGMVTVDPSGTTGTITWSGTFTLPRHGTLTLTFSATASATPGTYNSNATWTIQGQTTYPTGPTAPVTVVNMSISKTVNVSQSLENAPVTYTITVNGPPTFSITSVTDTLPAGFTYVTGSTTGLTAADPSGTTGTITWNGSWSLPSNGIVTLSFQAKTPATRGTYTNTATASGTGYGPLSTGATAPVQVISPVMSFGKTADKADVPPGGTITYTMTYSNTGDAPAYTVIILDNIPAYTTYVTGSTTGAGATIQWSHDGGNTWNSSDAAPVTGIKWTVSPVAPTAGGTAGFKVTVN